MEEEGINIIGDVECSPPFGNDPRSCWIWFQCGCERIRLEKIERIERKIYYKSQCDVWRIYTKGKDHSTGLSPIFVIQYHPQKKN
jgi:hypothetical protein